MIKALALVTSPIGVLVPFFNVALLTHVELSSGHGYMSFFNLLIAEFKSAILHCATVKHI